MCAMTTNWYYSELTCSFLSSSIRISSAFSCRVRSSLRPPTPRYSPTSHSLNTLHTVCVYQLTMMSLYLVALATSCCSVLNLYTRPNTNLSVSVCARLTVLSEPRASSNLCCCLSWSLSRSVLNESLGSSINTRRAS